MYGQMFLMSSSTKAAPPSEGSPSLANRSQDPCVTGLSPFEMPKTPESAPLLARAMQGTGTTTNKGSDSSKKKGGQKSGRTWKTLLFLEDG